MHDLTRTYDLLEAPCWVIDILPRQVPAGSPGSYFAVERHYLAHPQVEALRARHVGLLLKLSCYYDLCVSTDAGEHWSENPEPALWPLLLRGHLDVSIPSAQALLVADADDTHLTLYNPSSDLLDLVRQLSSSEGLFVWQPPRA